MKIVDSYKKQLESAESSYIDIIIKSGGLLTYEEVMTMPLDSIALFVSRLNAHLEEKKTAASTMRR